MCIWFAFSLFFSFSEKAIKGDPGVDVAALQAALATCQAEVVTWQHRVTAAEQDADAAKRDLSQVQLELHQAKNDHEQALVQLRGTMQQECQLAVEAAVEALQARLAQEATEEREAAVSALRASLQEASAATLQAQQAQHEQAVAAAVAATRGVAEQELAALQLQLDNAMGDNASLTVRLQQLIAEGEIAGSAAQDTISTLGQELADAQGSATEAAASAALSLQAAENQVSRLEEEVRGVEATCTALKEQLASVTSERDASVAAAADLKSRLDSTVGDADAATASLLGDLHAARSQIAALQDSLHHAAQETNDAAAAHTAHNTQVGTVKQC
jgi:exonuclease SbcC